MSVKLTDGSPGMFGYANVLYTAGDFIFFTYFDEAWRIKVARLSRETLANQGTVDLGPTGLIGDSHVHPTLLIDPTDNKVVVIRTARYKVGGDIRACIWKSNHAFGGTDEQWAAGDFGSSSNIPLPPKGLPSYAMSFFTSNGTLAVFSGNRDSTQNGTPTSRGTMLYRYIGDGTSKTAAQLCSGSWTEVIAQPTDLSPITDVNSGTMYAGIPARKGDVGVGIAFTTYWHRFAGSPHDQWGVSFIECEDITAPSPVWKMADGTVWNTGRKYDIAARTNAVLTPWQGQTSYHHATVYDDDGHPRIIYARIVMDSNYNLPVSGELWKATWDGAAWQHELFDADMETISFPIVKAAWRNGHIVLNADGEYRVDDELVHDFAPADGISRGVWAMHVDNENAHIAWRVLDGAPAQVMYERVSLSAALPPHDFDVLLTADPVDPLPEYDFDIGLLADPAPPVPAWVTVGTAQHARIEVRPKGRDFLPEASDILQARSGYYMNGDWYGSDGIGGTIALRTAAETLRTGLLTNHNWNSTFVLEIVGSVITVTHGGSVLAQLTNTEYTNAGVWAYNSAYVDLVSFTNLDPVEASASDTSTMSHTAMGSIVSVLVSASAALSSFFSTTGAAQRKGGVQSVSGAERFEMRASSGLTRVLGDLIEAIASPRQYLTARVSSEAAATITVPKPPEPEVPVTPPAAMYCTPLPMTKACGDSFGQSGYLMSELVDHAYFLADERRGGILAESEILRTMRMAVNLVFSKTAYPLIDATSSVDASGYAVQLHDAHIGAWRKPSVERVTLTDASGKQTELREAPEPMEPRRVKPSGYFLRGDRLVLDSIPDASYGLSVRYRYQPEGAEMGDFIPLTNEQAEIAVIYTVHQIKLKDDQLSTADRWAVTLNDRMRSLQEGETGVFNYSGE